jgi:hypothetical protein
MASVAEVDGGPPPSSPPPPPPSSRQAAKHRSGAALAGFGAGGSGRAGERLLRLAARRRVGWSACG